MRALHVTRAQIKINKPIIGRAERRLRRFELTPRRGGVSLGAAIQSRGLCRQPDIRPSSFFHARRGQRGKMALDAKRRHLAIRALRRRAAPRSREQTSPRDAYSADCERRERLIFRVISSLRGHGNAVFSVPGRKFLSIAPRERHDATVARRHRTRRCDKTSLLQ